MIQFRRQPTSKAIAGVISFIIYSLHVANKSGHILTLAASALLSLVVALICALFLFVEPIPQSQSYHNFADKRIFLCSCHGTSEGFFLPPGTNRNRNNGFIIPNFGDVVSNFVIFVGGVFGLALMYFNRAEVVDEDPIRTWQLKVCLPIFFSSTVAISAGSTYYHWSPSNNSLVWDRLPMTLAFVSIFCFMLEEYIPTVGIGQSLLHPFLGIGVFSVLYWSWTDDLRLYALVQFLPLVMIAALLACYQSRHGGTVQQTFGLVCYAIAKVCEERDYEIYSWTNRIISGHSLKHVFAGLASISIASMMLMNEGD